MLVLSRRLGESLIVMVPPSDKPTKLRIAVTDIRAFQAKIGVDAPADVTIDREEVFKRKEKEREQNPGG